MFQKWANIAIYNVGVNMKDFAIITLPKLTGISEAQLKGIRDLLGMPVLFLERGMEFKMGEMAEEELIRLREQIDGLLNVPENPADTID